MVLTQGMKKAILIKYDIKKAGIFGSYARGDAREGYSDIDLIVEPAKNDLFELSALKADLE